MNTPSFRVTSLFALAVVVTLLVIWETEAQDALTRDQPSSTSLASMDAERAKIWNSPQMVKARAWVKDYCAKSARITPEESAEYQRELANLTPKQMKLWLLKFEHEEEQRQAQYKAWQQTHELALRHAMAVDKATRQAYANISKGETEAAQNAQKQFDTEQQRGFEMEKEKMLDLNAPGLGYPVLPGGYGYYGGWGGPHYHFHIYPGAP